MVRCLRVIASFIPNSSGFLKLVTDFLMQRFIDDIKKGRGDPDKTLVSWDVGEYKVGQEVAVASLFLSLKDQSGLG